MHNLQHHRRVRRLRLLDDEIRVAAAEGVCVVSTGRIVEYDLPSDLPHVVGDVLFAVGVLVAHVPAVAGDVEGDAWGDGLVEGDGGPVLEGVLLRCVEGG